jgi:hypothetical protein
MLVRVLSSRMELTAQAVSLTSTMGGQSDLPSQMDGGVLGDT